MGIRLIALCGALSALFGCARSPLESGAIPPSSPEGSGAGAGGVGSAGAAGNAGELPAGLWIGESESSLVCPGPSPRIALEIVPGVPGAPTTGTIVFGEGAFPRSTVDPEQPYPIGADRDEIICRTANPSEGFPYTVVSDDVSVAGRLVFRVNIAEPYAEWCALQTSAPWDYVASGYSCMPPITDQDVATCESTPERCPIPAGRFQLCMWPSACLCSPDGCGANPNLIHRFELQVSGSSMEGVVTTWFVNEQLPIAVRLRRVE